MPSIKDIFTIRKGKKANETDNSSPDSERYIQIEDLRNDNNLKYTEDTNLIAVDTSDIVIAWDGANAGFVGFDLKGIIGSTLARLRLKEEYRSRYFPKYLGYFLSSKFNYLQETATGATIPHVSRQALQSIDVPLIDIQTQQQIVEALDRAQSLIKKREKSIVLLDDLKHAIFLEMFGEPPTNKKNWKSEKLGDHIEFITSGSRGWSKYYSEYGTLFLRIGNIGYNALLLEDNVYVQAPDTAEAKRTKVQEGDLLVSITADLGRTAVIPEGLETAHINQHLALIRLDDKLNPHFVSAYISSIGGRHLLKKYSKGAAKSGLNFDDIKSLQIFIPDKFIQRNFENSIKYVEELKERIEKSLIHIEELMRSLLQRAFHGDLSFQSELQLDALVENKDIEAITKDGSLIQELVDRFNQHNQKEEFIKSDGGNGDSFSFDTFEEYERAKEILFKLMKKDKVEQKYNEDNKQTILQMK